MMGKSTGNLPVWKHCVGRFDADGPAVVLDANKEAVEDREERQRKWWTSKELDPADDLGLLLLPNWPQKD